MQPMLTNAELTAKVQRLEDTVVALSRLLVRAVRRETEYHGHTFETRAALKHAQELTQQLLSPEELAREQMEAANGR